VCFIRSFSEPVLLSDADDEIIITCRFTSPCTLRKMMIIGGDNIEQQPATLHCFVEKDNIDFTNIDDHRPVQSFSLAANPEGTVELFTNLRHFTNVSTLTLHFKGNLGGMETSSLRYVGLQGDHTHYRREAVNTVYEVLCNGQDICQPEDSNGASAHFH
jgi:hypothetical protein